MTKKSFAIVGAGIGGLTLAIALHRKGLNVNVFENAPAIKPLGAGLTLAGNAVKALMEIGIGDSVLREGKVMKTILIKNAKGTTLASTNAEKLTQKYKTINNFAIHRGDLHRVLLKEFPSANITLDKGCVDIRKNNSEMVLTFSDGTQASADYVIACDGIHSVIRKKYLPKSTTRYAGYTCWRAVIDHIPPSVNLEETVEYWGHGSRFGIVPLTNNRLYWFACLNAPQGNHIMRKFSIDDLLVHFGTYETPVVDILKGTRNEQLIWGDILDIAPIKRFVFDNVVLLGDAAHATTPNLGQGACMAIEDAAVLSNCLEDYDSVEEAFRQFERKRITRTTKIVNASRNVGKIAQLENLILVALRNAAVRLTPDSVAEKQMKFLMDVSFN
jgi:2-polyprenyl-6-methoxyphenol hydroxylase-like FAD-dependent oxidoreductase